MFNLVDSGALSSGQSALALPRPKTSILCVRKPFDKALGTEMQSSLFTSLQTHSYALEVKNVKFLSPETYPPFQPQDLLS